MEVAVTVEDAVVPLAIATVTLAPLATATGSTTTLLTTATLNPQASMYQQAMTTILTMSTGEMPAKSAPPNITTIE